MGLRPNGLTEGQIGGTPRNQQARLCRPQRMIPLRRF